MGSAEQRLVDVVELPAARGGHPQVRTQAQRARPVDLQGQVGPVLLPAVLTADADPAARDVPIARAHALEQPGWYRDSPRGREARRRSRDARRAPPPRRPGPLRGEGDGRVTPSKTPTSDRRRRVSRTRAEGERLTAVQGHLAPGDPIEGVDETADLDVPDHGVPRRVPDREAPRRSGPRGGGPRRGDRACRRRLGGEGRPRRSRTASS